MEIDGQKKAGSYSFNEVVVRDLGEEVVDDMGADVVVDVVDPAVVPVHRGESATQVAPLLAAVPGEVMAAVVVQVGHQVKPHHKHLRDASILVQFELLAGLIDSTKY